MGNLGLYEWLTTAAKEAGGPEKLIELIKSDAAKEAVSKAAPALIAAGAAAGALGVKGYELAKEKWVQRKEEKAAAAEAEAKLVALIEEADRAQATQDSKGSPGPGDTEDRPSAD